MQKGHRLRRRRSFQSVNLSILTFGREGKVSCFNENDVLSALLISGSECRNVFRNTYLALVISELISKYGKVLYCLA